MPRIVIDANVMLARLLREPSAPLVAGVLDQSELVAPSLWRLEVVNTILVHERRHSITRAEADQMIGLIDRMVIELVADPIDRPVSALADFARPHQLTTYDALYLELADRLGLPLFTFDKNLSAAAKRQSVQLVMP